MIEWFKANGEHIAAGIGALYALARVIVYLTPTPRDDEALAKVSAPLRALGAAMGLNLKVGTEAKPEADKPVAK